VYALKSFAHRKMGETEQAVQSFNKFLKNAESDSSAYYYTTRGNLKIENNDYNGAIEDFMQASELDPGNEKVYYYRFLANYKIGEYRNALNEIDRLIELNPDFYGYYLYRGNTKLALGDFKNANDDYSKSIQLNDRNADAYYLRGIVSDTLRQFNTAIEDYSKAIILKPEEGTYYSKRGNTKMQLGNKDGACLDWTIAGEFGYYKDFDKIKKVCQ
jgi:tetratricopeptide (TPR) repeat protein